MRFRLPWPSTFIPIPANSGFAAVKALPTAGATPGNAQFAQAWIKAYPPSSIPGVSAAYGVWNTDLANGVDVVPHAWNQLSGWVKHAGLDPYFTSPWGDFNLPFGGVMSGAVAGAIKLSSNGSYLNLTQQIFPCPSWGKYQWTQNADGTYQYPPNWQPLPTYAWKLNPVKSNTIDNLIELGPIVLGTHVDQYMQFFNVLPPPKFPSKKPAAASDDDDHHDAMMVAASGLRD